MKKSIGRQNLTGANRAPDLVQQMIAATEEFPPSSRGNASAIAKVRAEYAAGAEPMGSMPLPATVGGMAKTALKTLAGQRPTLLLDKLGERLAFERTGTRLYEAIISKHDAGRTFRGGPSRAELAHIRDEEHEHFMLVAAAIEQLGGDPTAVTPSANLQATASKGLPAVMADARTDVLQCLEAVLTAELVDNDCWPALIELTDAAGHAALAKTFRKALENEREHLEHVRGWVAAGTGRSVERSREVGEETRREPMQGTGSSSGSSPAGNGRARRASRSTKRGRRTGSSRRNARGSAKRGRKRQGSR